MSPESQPPFWQKQQARRLREARLARHLSQAALAARLKVTTREVSRWETAQASPNHYAREKLEGLFGPSTLDTAPVTSVLLDQNIPVLPPSAWLDVVPNWPVSKQSCARGEDQ
ncbi:MAG TPA: helix-turn-helix domain-containing protein [Ktedonosporobacter sp.]|nr:helix-turn-helix domain-containing protein [Ktedonosporobacter sp.]